MPATPSFQASGPAFGTVNIPVPDAYELRMHRLPGGDIEVQATFRFADRARADRLATSLTDHFVARLTGGDNSGEAFG
jgi:hypothetical protein